MRALLRYDAAKRALAEAHRVDEVKDIRDKAVAMQAYAKQAKDTTLIVQATEIRMRAECRAGELLIEMADRKERHNGRNVKGKTVQGLPRVTPEKAPKLADLGINKTQSSRWQKLAALDADTFEAKVEAASKRAYDNVARRFIKAEEIKHAKERPRLIEHGCTVDDLFALIASGRRFGVIYADPPWPWNTWGGSPAGKIHSAPDNHYNTQTIDEIIKLPVAQLAADNCALLLWCTAAHIAIGTHTGTIEAWGFRSCTKAFCWIKQAQNGGPRNSGQGYYTLANSEDVFLGIKGSPLRLANDVHQVVMAPVGEHSAKPEEVRRCIERLFPGPYLELYARKPAPGWTCWGNEILRTEFNDERPVLRVEDLSTRIAPVPDDLDIPPFLRRMPPEAAQ
jgi:N6-adenosine-specific RNA methylase IME4